MSQMLHYSQCQKPNETTPCWNDGGHTILCPYPSKSIIWARCQESPVALLEGKIANLLFNLPQLLSPLPQGKTRTGEMWTDDQELTFQSSEVTSLLLGTSWPPSRIQWRSTSWVELELLFSFRFQIRAVESPELNRIPTQQVGGQKIIGT